MHTNPLLVYSAEKNNEDFNIFPHYCAQYIKRIYSNITSCIVFNGGEKLKDTHMGRGGWKGVLLFQLKLEAGQKGMLSVLHEQAQPHS